MEDLYSKTALNDARLIGSAILEYCFKKHGYKDNKSDNTFNLATNEAAAICKEIGLVRIQHKGSIIHLYLHQPGILIGVRGELIGKITEIFKKHYEPTDFSDFKLHIVHNTLDTALLNWQYAFVKYTEPVYYS